jgi:hypothetical protein
MRWIYHGILCKVSEDPAPHPPQFFFGKLVRMCFCGSQEKMGMHCYIRSSIDSYAFEANS